MTRDWLFSRGCFVYNCIIIAAALTLFVVKHAP